MNRVKIDGKYRVVENLQEAIDIVNKNGGGKLALYPEVYYCDPSPVVRSKVQIIGHDTVLFKRGIK